MSASDRHSDARQEPGQTRRRLVDRQRQVKCGLVRERRGHRLRDRRTLRQEHQRLLDALVVALEHVEHDLEVRQRLRQRIPHVAEYLVDLIGCRRRLGQNASQRAGPSARVCAANMLRLRAQRWIAPLESTWLSSTGPEFWMMSLTSVDLVLEIADDRLGGVDEPLQGGPQPADGLCRLIEQRRDLLLGQHRKPTVGGVQRRPDLAGHACPW